MVPDSTTQHLPRYLDNEVSEDEAQQIHAHLLTCPVCAAELAMLVRMKRALRSAHLRFEPSPDFQRRVHTQISPPRRLTWRKLGLLAIGQVFAMLLLGLTVKYWATQSDQNAFSEIIDLHVATLASANPVDVVSSDRHTVKPWFEGRLPFTFDVPELKGTEFTLIGGRVTYLHQAPGGHLVFGFGKHRISLFVFQNRPELQLEIPNDDAGSTNYSYSFYSSSEEGLRFVLVGDVNSQEAQKLGQLIYAANKK
jgi:anti-sigma factor RsiW